MKDDFKRAEPANAALKVRVQPARARGLSDAQRPGGGGQFFLNMEWNWDFIPDVSAFLLPVPRGCSPRISPALTPPPAAPRAQAYYKALLVCCSGDGQVESRERAWVMGLAAAQGLPRVRRRAQLSLPDAGPLVGAGGGPQAAGVQQAEPHQAAGGVQRTARSPQLAPRADKRRSAGPCAQALQFTGCEKAFLYHALWACTRCVSLRAREAIALLLTCAARRRRDGDLQEGERKKILVGACGGVTRLMLCLFTRVGACRRRPRFSTCATQVCCAAAMIAGSRPPESEAAKCMHSDAPAALCFAPCTRRGGCGAAGVPEGDARAR
jgi:hypothetical protein